MKNATTLLVLLATSLAISGCVTEANEVTESLNILSNARDQGQSPPGPASQASGTHCELVNGRGCTEDRPRAEERETTYFSSATGCRVANQFPGETLDQWKARDPVGARCLVEEGRKVLADLDEMRRQEAAPADVAIESSEDTSGTWYCDDSVDGSGNYGTYGMREDPRFYDCKRVGD